MADGDTSSAGQSANEQPHDVSPKPANLTCSRQPLLPTLTARALPDGVADMQWIGWAVIGVMVWSGSGRAEQRQTLLLPVSTTCISSAFGPRILPNRPQAGTFHNGLDLPAPEGSPVRATTAGVPLRVQHNGPGGLEVLVQHIGFVGVYSHLGLIAPRLQAGGNVTIEAGATTGRRWPYRRELRTSSLLRNVTRSPAGQPSAFFACAALWRRSSA